MTDELTDLPGVGDDLAEKLEAAGFGTVEDLEDATLEDLLEIDGVGEAKAEGILAALSQAGGRPRPELDEETRRALKLRKKQKGSQPRFRRQGLGRWKRVGDTWRAPRGQHSKQRKDLRYRASRPKVGHRGPKAARGLHPSGFEEVHVHRPEDLDGIDPETQAARIGGSVGKKKRARILERAEELGIHVLNPGKVV